MKSSTVRIGKRIMAVLLSLMMVVGVFAGMKLDVRAANTYTAGDELKKVKFVKEGDIIVVPAPESGIPHEIIATIYVPDDSSTREIWHIETDKQEEKNVPSIGTGNKDYSNYKVLQCNYISKNDGGYKWDIILYAVDESEVVPTEVVSGNESQSGVRVVEIPSHTCNFQWTTTLDPSAGVDGLEEYKCVYCGAVQESHSIPAGVAVVKDFYGKVKDAPENGTVTYDSGKLYTISDYLLKKLSERSDVTLTVNFEYQNAKYELTFPAGTDFTPVLMDEETMYGYFGVAAKLGLTVAAK